MITLDDHAAAASARGSRRRVGSATTDIGGGAPAPALTLDPSSSRRAGARLLGVGIARRRLLSGYRRGDTDNGTGGPPPTLIFRRDAEQQDHQQRRRRRPRPGADDDPSSGGNLGAPSSYLSAAFLTDDVVLASDDAGFVDVVRLPRYDAGGGGGCGGGGCVGTTTTRTGRGTLLAGRLGEDRAGDSGFTFGPPLSSHPPPHVAMRGFRGGDAFACGMRSGELRVFATERLELDPSSSSSSPFVASAARVGGPRRRFRRGGSRCSLARMLAASGMASSPLLPPPPPPSPSSRFRFHPDRDDRHLDEIPGWDAGLDGGDGDGGGVAPPPVPPDRSCDDYAFRLEREARRNGTGSLEDFSAVSRRNDVSWDFCEGGGFGLGGGGLLAAHVDCEADCFSLRLIDDRTCRGGRGSQQVGGGGRVVDPSAAVMAVCVDKSSLDWRRCRVAGLPDRTCPATEDVTGVCFASGCRLWTSHVVQRHVTVKQFAWSATPRHNSIKQWDLRMLSPRRGAALPAEEYGLVVPSSAASHPSFPLDDVRGCAPTDEYAVSLGRRDRGDGAGHLRFIRVSEGGGMGSGREGGAASLATAREERQRRDNLVITSLTSSLDGTTVLATLRGLLNGGHHRPVLLDSSPGRGEDALRVLGGPPVLSVDGGGGCYHQPFHQPSVLQAVTPDHDVLVCHGAVHEFDEDDEVEDEDDLPQDGQSVMLFDLSSRRGAGGVGGGPPGDGHPPRRGAKRSREGASHARGDDDGAADAATASPMLGRLPVDALVDEIGLRSQLTCLATDRWGTAVVCGTADGDLYAWRGA